MWEFSPSLCTATLYRNMLVIFNNVSLSHNMAFTMTGCAVYLCTCFCILLAYSNKTADRSGWPSVETLCKSRRLSVLRSLAYSSNQFRSRDCREIVLNGVVQ